MAYIRLHILCNRDTRSPEDLALEEQFAKLEIPLKTQTKPEDRIVQEWRAGFIKVEHISCVYPHALPEHSLIHLHAGPPVTVKESVDVVMTCLAQFENKMNNMVPAASPGYSYSLVADKPIPVKP